MSRTYVSETGGKVHLSGMCGLSVQALKPCGKAEMKLEFMSLTEVLPASLYQYKQETPGLEAEVILQHVPGFDAISAPWSAFELKSDTAASVPYYLSTSEFTVSVIKLSRTTPPVVQPQRVQLKLTVKIYAGDGTIQNEANQNLNVSKDTVYIGYELRSAWPFAEIGSQVKVKVKLTGKGGMHHIASLLLDETNDTEIPYILCGPGALLPSSEFVVDGREAPTIVDREILRNQINVYFPHYTSALRHDFLLDMSSSIATTPDITDPKVCKDPDPFTLSKKWIYVGCVVVFLLLCIGIVFWNRNRIMRVLRPGAISQALLVNSTTASNSGKASSGQQPLTNAQQSQLPHDTEGSVSGNGELFMQRRPIF
jgi:hypothetical protein